MSIEQLLWAGHHFANTTGFQIFFWGTMGALCTFSVVVWYQEMTRPYRKTNKREK